MAKNPLCEVLQPPPNAISYLTDPWIPHLLLQTHTPVLRLIKVWSSTFFLVVIEMRENLDKAFTRIPRESKSIMPC